MKCTLGREQTLLAGASLRFPSRVGPPSREAFVPPPPTGLGASGFCREDARYLLTQNGATIPGSPPHHVPVNPEVRVDKNVTEGYDLWPRHLGVAGLEVFRDSRGRLAYDGELLNYGAAQQFRFLKYLKISDCDELGNVVGGLNDIREVQALMPHTRAA